MFRPLVSRQLLRHPLLLLSIVIAAGVWVASYSIVQSERQMRLNQSLARANDLARYFEGNTLRILRYCDVYLQEARRIYLATGSLDAVDSFMAAVPRDTSILSHITILDADGTPIYISGYETRPDVTAADRPYYKFQKSTPGDQIYISLPHRGRNTGRLVMRLVRRIETPEGAFLGAIFAAIDVARITEFISAIRLGENTSATLVGLDKKIRARSSYGRFGPGQDISASRLWQRLEKEPVGLFNQTSVVDGINRYYAYRKLNTYPLITAIGAASDDILKGTRRFERSVYITAALVTVVIVILTGATLRDAARLGTLRREVAERRRAEIEARRANEAKSTFLATMSHEIRTPINAIMGLFELIERAPVPERQKAQARAGHTAAGELFKQLNNVLEASRIGANALDVAPQPESAAALAADIKEWLKAEIARSGKPISADVTLAPDVPATVVIDRRRVDQVAINLIGNAVKFTAAGRIAIAIDTVTKGSHDHLRIAVADTGPGIPDRDQDRIFERFAQADSAMTRAAGGAGLGLAICRELATLMGGTLELDSTPGKGATFTLRLPLNTPPQGAGQA